MNKKLCMRDSFGNPSSMEKTIYFKNAEMLISEKTRCKKTTRNTITAIDLSEKLVRTIAEALYIEQ